MTSILLVVSVVLVVLVLVWLSSGQYFSESFAIAERDGRPCPQTNNTEAYLMPNSIVLVIMGYNYAETPRIMRDGRYIMPLQYTWDYTNMTYRFVVEAPKGLSGSSFVIETSDFVKPVVFEGRHLKELQVTSLEKEDGRNKWSIMQK